MPGCSTARWKQATALTQLLAFLIGQVQPSRRHCSVRFYDQTCIFIICCNLNFHRFVAHPFSISLREDAPLSITQHLDMSEADTPIPAPNITDVHLKIPAYVIVGAQKSGTSALYFGLCEHQNISCSAYVKEPFFLTNTITEEFVRTSEISFSQNAARDFQQKYACNCVYASILDST